MKSNKGFTLIELLVVIAVIGILAGVLLVSLGGARQQARDTRIISDLKQIQAAAETFYSQKGFYTGFVADTTLSGDISTNGGLLTPNVGAQAYCFSSSLNNTTGGGNYCVDSAGVSDRKSGACTTTACP